MDHGELREPTFLILASVAAAPQHGYGIKRAIEAAIDGRYEVSTGTVYTALNRLVEAGLIAETGAEVVQGRRRRYYLLSQSGANVLAAEISRLRSNASHAAHQLGARIEHSSAG